MALVTSKTTALKSLLMRAWRERWSDIQWGIHLKSVLPRGCSGDAYNLCSLILQQALVGPVPNELILSYLRHSLAAQTVSHAALLEAISCFGPDGSTIPTENGSTPSDEVAAGRNASGLRHRRPHCVATLLQFVQSSQSCMTSRGKPEECVALASSTLKVTLWLLKVMTSVGESMTNVAGGGLRTMSDVEKKNFATALSLVKHFIDTEFTLCLLYIGKAEDKDTYDKALQVSQQLYDMARLGSLNGGSDFASTVADLKTDLSKLSSSLSNLEPVRNFSSITSLPSFVHSIQPMLIFEALLRPTSDLTTLASHLHALAVMHNITFTDLLFEIIRCLLLSVPQKEGFESLKLDAFILISFPSLLEKVHKLMKHHNGDNGGSLKTPTDLYKVFDRILTCDMLLNAVDVRCQCNIVELLMRVIRKCSVQLMTETEMEDVMKKREKQVAESGIKDMSNVEEIVGNSRQFGLTLKAETTLDEVFKTLDVDFSRPECIESRLGVLSCIIREEGFNLLLIAACANGKLNSFVKCLIKCNQQSQESQGESVKNSLLRAALFDVTLLMIVHVVQLFGSEVVLLEAQGTFIETLVADMTLESEHRVKPFNSVNVNDNNVDTLLQQLANGDLRTQVVKWKNVCTNIHQAFKEMVIARSLGHLKDEEYNKMCSTLCSKLCALPVCVVNFVASWMSSLPEGSSINLRETFKELIQIIEKAAEEKIEQQLQQQQQANGGSGGNGQLSIATITSATTSSSSTDLPLMKERMAMMGSILQRIQWQTGMKCSGTGSRLNSPEMPFYDPKAMAMMLQRKSSRSLKETLVETWNQVCQRGWMSVEDTWRLHALLKTGGPNWFTSGLVEELLSVIYQTNLDTMTDLLLSIFCIDIEQCTLALLLHVIPGYLQYRNKRDKLTDPHGTALAKLTVGCIYIVLIGVHSHSAKQTSASATTSGVGKKRSADEMSDEVPSAKMRRLVGLPNENLSQGASSTAASYASSYDDYLSGIMTHSRQSSSPADSKQDELASHPVTQAVAGFFRLLHNVVSCQESAVTPCTHFAFRFLEQAVLRGGRHHHYKSRLIFQHLSSSLVIHLVKTVPHLFSMGIISKLFDIGSVGGRKNMARLMCLLKNILGSKKHRDNDLQRLHDVSTVGSPLIQQQG